MMKKKLNPFDPAGKKLSSAEMMKRNDSVFEVHQGYSFPRCLWPWGMMHVLDYYHSRQKKMLPWKRQGKKKHATGYGNPKMDSSKTSGDEVQGYLTAESAPLLDYRVEPETGKTNTRHKKAKETSSIDSFELNPSVSIRGITDDWANPIIILRKSNDFIDSEKPAELIASDDKSGSKAKKSQKDPDSTSGPQLKECVDVLGMFKVNKNVFLEIFQDSDIEPVKNFNMEKAKLRKSGTYPSGNSSSNKRFAGPCTTIEHKQKEVWFNKAQEPKVIVKHEKSTQKTSSGSNKQRWHQSFMSYFKGIKKKLKKAIKEHKKQNSITSADALVQQNSNEIMTNGTVIDDNNGEAVQFRRSTSIHESIDKYTRLLDSIGEHKWHEYQSKSLRLANDDHRLSLGSSGLKSYKRRLSLPDIDYLLNEHSCSFRLGSEEGIVKADEVLEDAHDPNNSKDDDQSPNSVLETFFEEGIICPVQIIVPEEPENPIAALVKFVHEDDNDDDSNYVRRVLEYTIPYHQIGQPLDATLFKQLETQLHDEDNAVCNHKLLFDMTNQVLLEICENVLGNNYFPKSFAFATTTSPCVCALLTGSLDTVGVIMVEQVWKRIRMYRDLSSKNDMSLDDLIGTDLDRGSSCWNMNTGLDAEDVALDIEDLLFDQLLHEILSL